MHLRILRSVGEDGLHHLGQVVDAVDADFCAGAETAGDLDIHGHLVSKAGGIPGSIVVGRVITWVNDGHIRHRVRRADLRPICGQVCCIRRAIESPDGDDLARAIANSGGSVVVKEILRPESKGSDGVVDREYMRMELRLKAQDA